MADKKVVVVEIASLETASKDGRGVAMLVFFRLCV